MCVIAVARTGQPLPSFAMFHRMWECNPHGAGFTYPALTEDRRPGIRIVKGLMSFTAFKEAVQRHRDQFADAEGRATVDVGFHFRIASAGGSSPKLTHPFFAGNDVTLMHNGHIGMLAYDDPMMQRELAGANPKPSRSASKGLSVFKDEYDSEIEKLKAMVAEGTITPGEAENFAQMYLDKPGKHAAEAAARTERLLNPESDTSRLADILSRLPLGWQRNEVCQFLIKEKFLRGDKVVIFDSEGLACILNEKNGTTDGEGRWYSNGYWAERETRIVSGQDMLKESDESTAVGEGAYRSNKSKGTIVRSSTWTAKATDKELREASDRLKQEMDKVPEGHFKPKLERDAWYVQQRREEAEKKQKGFKPHDGSDLQRRRNTPRLGCTLGANLPQGEPDVPDLPPVKPTFFGGEDGDDGAPVGV